MLYVTIENNSQVLSEAINHFLATYTKEKVELTDFNIVPNFNRKALTYLDIRENLNGYGHKIAVVNLGQLVYGDERNFRISVLMNLTALISYFIKRNIFLLEKA